MLSGQITRLNDGVQFFRSAAFPVPLDERVQPDVQQYAKEDGRFDEAFAIAAILLGLTLLINLAAAAVGRYFRKRRSL